MPATQPIAASNRDRSRWIKEKALDAIERLFPIITDRYTIKLSNLTIKEKAFSISEQKKAILEGKTLNESVFGDLTIVSNDTKKMVHKFTKFKIVDIPYLTKRSTMIIDGNDYALVNQLRLKSGIYSRQRENEIIEAFFNLSVGRNFRMTMNPATGIFYLEFEHTKIELYPLFRAFGVSDYQLNEVWGDKLVARNRDRTGGKEEVAVNKLYSKVFTMKDSDRFLSVRDKTNKLSEYFSKTKMDSEVNLSTLGEKFDKVTLPAMLTTSAKILKILQGKEKVDDRDNLKYQIIHTIDDSIAENITKTAPDIIRKIKYKLDSLPKGKDMEIALPKNIFGPSVKKFLTTSSVASPLPQVNPLEILNSKFEVTHLGPGGIKDIRMVRNETRQVNASHINVIDPIFTKENEKAGVTLTSTFNSYRDKKGNLYTVLTNVKTGKEEQVSVADLENKVIAFPNQDLSKKTSRVEVLYKGRVQRLPASKVEYGLRMLLTCSRCPRI